MSSDSYKYGPDKAQTLSCHLEQRAQISWFVNLRDSNNPVLILKTRNFRKAWRQDRTYTRKSDSIKQVPRSGGNPAVQVNITRGNTWKHWAWSLSVKQRARLLPSRAISASTGLQTNCLEKVGGGDISLQEIRSRGNSSSVVLLYTRKALVEPNKKRIMKVLKEPSSKAKNDVHIIYEAW